MITVGLDFGTHQTKICIENNEDVELSYEFFKFKDTLGNEQYVLPSVIGISEDDCLMYGYLDNKDTENEKNNIINQLKSLNKIFKIKVSSKKKKIKEIHKYFKQVTFSGVNKSQKQEAIYYSVWYISYLLFLLKEKYGDDFRIQMGVPADGEHFQERRNLAVRIMLSAYRLVEDVLQNDKKKFLSLSVQKLKKITNIVEYDEEKRYYYQILVFPEAYACLMPLTSTDKISSGMSIMVDIGGGTTDISFFTIKNKRPQVYDFYSIDKGLNYLVEIDEINNKDRFDGNLSSLTKFNFNRKEDLFRNITQIHSQIVDRLRKEFHEQCSYLSMQNLMDALESRPIIYTGGGSTFGDLRKKYSGFNDIIHVSDSAWQSRYIKNIQEIRQKGLAPILSTSYGLSINVSNDDISCEKFDDIFENIKKHHPKIDKMNRGGMAGDSFDYAHLEG